MTNETTGMNNVTTGATKQTNISPLELMSLYHEFTRNQDLLFASVSVISSFCGIIGNIFILNIFYADRRQLSTKIFLVIAVTDLITSSNGAIPFSVSRFLFRAPALFSSAVFCNVSGVIDNITSRMSVFLISVLSCTRCLAVIRPLLRVNVKAVIAAIVSYVVIQLLIACIPFVNYFFVLDSSALYNFDPIYTKCTWQVDLVVSPTTKLFIFSEYMLLFVPFFFPSVFVVTSCIICICSLKNASVKQSRSNLELSGSLHIRSAERRTEVEKHRATWTVAIITLVFVLLNIPYWIILFLFFIEQNSNLTIMNYQSEYMRALFVFCSNVSLYINAGVNPFIYIFRVRSIRRKMNTIIIRFLIIIRMRKTKETSVIIRSDYYVRSNRGRSIDSLGNLPMGVIRSQSLCHTASTNAARRMNYSTVDLPSSQTLRVSDGDNSLSPMVAGSLPPNTVS